ncbi:WhiB family transcriptional regulator [Streptomyces mobaraensis]|uniref:WhiB family transcriptional regulator n=1 Tax=Streptomyces mobaraensis TaxID=35621 RepID=UPI00332FFA8F
MDWRQYAACTEEDPDLFFPIGTGAPALAQAEGAKSVCARCPVREECLRWAVETRQEYGVWGGTSEGDRRELLRGTGRRRVGTSS